MAREETRRSGLAARLVSAAAAPEGSGASARAESTRGGGAIPSHEHYTSPASSRAWIDFCSSGAFARHEAGKRLLREVAATLAPDFLRAPAGGGRASLISLGVGDGVKDLEIMRRVRGSLNITYWPVDVSSTFLENCSEAARREGVKVVPVCGNFLHIGNAINGENCREPRVVALLGNTIGNLDQTEACSALRRLVRKGDLAVVEVFVVGAGEEEAAGEVYGSPAYHEFLLAAVAGAGLDPRGGRLDVDFGRLSVCGQEVRVVQNYFVLGGEVVVEGGGGKLRLAAGHRLPLVKSLRYGRDSLCRIISDNGFQVVRFAQRGGVAVAFCRRKT